MSIVFTYLRQPLNRYTFKAPKIKAWVESRCYGNVLNLFAGYELIDAENISQAHKLSSERTPKHWYIYDIRQVGDDSKPSDFKPMYIQKEIHKHEEEMNKFKELTKS